MTWSTRSLTSSCFVLLVLFSNVGFGQTTTNIALPEQRHLFLDRAQDFERRQLWQQAADLYQRALRIYPEDSELRQRWNTAEQFYSLSRRYHDVSFQKDLLTLSEPESLGLYREVLAKIQTHYVREVPVRDLVLSGYRTLSVALDRPIFVSTNFPKTSPDVLMQLRTRVAQAAGRLGQINSNLEASAELRNVVRLCTVHGCKYTAAAPLEFITGACESLDPYTTHLSPNRLDELYSMIDGNFVGLGVEVRGEDQGLRIVEVLPSSPANDAGLHDEELILSVDGVRLAGHNAEEAANRLQGPDGSAVSIEVQNESGQSRMVSIIRREVIVHSVREARIIDKTTGVGYVRIESFQKNTEDELRTVLDDLERQGMRSLVVDLRGNPGGLLDVSLDVANQFIGEGVLVSTRGRAWGQNWAHRARPKATRKLPMVVLVDSESASASEIFASAIQDHHRGTIVGTRSYGKGSVQSIFPLTTVRTGLRLTTALFFSPTDKRLQGVGVEPDVVVTRGESQLGEEPPVLRKPTPETDRQLRTAMEQLTGASLAVQSR